MNSLRSFKRLCPTYPGAYLPEELRQRFETFWHDNQSCRYEPDGWAWDFGSGGFQCELTVCDLDSDLETAGYLAIQLLSELEPYRINCVLDDDEEFGADAEIVSSKIFRTMAEAKEFLDSLLAFRTPKIPAVK
jgi:hypothetical protein